MRRNWQTTVGLGLLIVLLSAGAPLAEAGLRGQALGAVVGSHPPPGANVGIECSAHHPDEDYHQLPRADVVAPLVFPESYTTACERLATLTGAWWIYVTTCTDLEDLETCSKFTGTLRATVSDGATADEVFEFDYLEGAQAHTDLWFWWPQGDNIISHGEPDVTIEVLPLQGHDPLTEESTGAIGPGPSGGHVYFYLVNP